MGSKPILESLHCFQREQNHKHDRSVDKDAWYKRTLTCEQSMNIVMEYPHVTEVSK